MEEGAGTKFGIEIAYCTRCHFLPRAAWVAQELLHTYANFVSGLTLMPAHGGVFEVRVDGEVIASTRTEGGFPEIRVLKERLNALLAAEEVATLKRHPKKEGA